MCGANCRDCIPNWPTCPCSPPLPRSAPASVARTTTPTCCAGPLTLRSAADLYFYPNTLTAVKTDGAGLKAWLENSAQRFNRIDPKQNHRQPLINRHYAGFNFDQIQGGLHYVIDVSRPVGQRITALT